MAPFLDSRWYTSTNVAALYAAAGAPPATTPAQDLVDTWASGGAGSDGFAMVFEDAGGTDAPSIYVKDSGTPANDTDINLTDDWDAFNSFLTYTSPSPKIVRQSDGDLKYCAHNLCLYSNAFSTTAGWTLAAATLSTGRSDPDGGSNAFKLVEDSTTAFHNVNTETTAKFPVVSGQTYRASVKVKAAELSYVQLLFGAGTMGVGYRNFNLSTGSVASGALFSGEITDLGGGWYECAIIGTATGSGTEELFIALTNDTDGSRALSYLGDGSSGLDIYQAQVSRYPADTTYLPTTTAARFALPIQHDSSNNAEGLLVEPASTNLLTYSSTLTSGWAISDAGSFTLTANDATGPDGESSLTKIEITDATNERHRIFLAYTGTASTATTSSFIIKPGTLRYVGIRSYLTVGGNYAWVNVTYDLTALSVTDVQTGSSGATQTHDASGIQNLGDGFYRIWVTTTPDNTDMNVMLQAHSSGTPTLNGLTAAESFAGTAGQYFHFFHAQIELGSVPTSPIITTGATATRANDNIALLSGFTYSGVSAHSIYAKYLPKITSATSTVYSLHVTSNNKTIRSRIHDNQHWYGQLPTNSFNLDAGTVSAGATTKIAGAFAADDAAASLDGGTVVTDTDTSGEFFETPTNFYLGGLYGINGQYMNGIIHEILYLPERMSNTDLESITT